MRNYSAVLVAAAVTVAVARGRPGSGPVPGTLGPFGPIGPIRTHRAQLGSFGPSGPGSGPDPRPIGPNLSAFGPGPNVCS